MTSAAEIMREIKEAAATNFTVESMAKRDEEDVHEAKKANEEEARKRDIEKRVRSFEAVGKKFMEEKRKEIVKQEKDQEEVLKKKIIQKIIKYQERFPFLEKAVPKLNQRASLAEVNEILEQIREIMNSQRSLNNLMKYVDMGLTVLEGSWGDGSAMTFLPPQMRFNLTGLSANFKRGMFSEQIEPLLLEIDIEYPWLGRQTLPMRVLETVSTVMLKTHVLNMNPELAKLMNLEKSAPVPLEREEIEKMMGKK